MYPHDYCWDSFNPASGIWKGMMQDAASTENYIGFDEAPF
jgi:hypothetical protein